MKKKILLSALLLFVILMITYLVLKKYGVLADVYPPFRVQQTPLFENITESYPVNSSTNLNEIQLTGLIGEKVSFSLAIRGVEDQQLLVQKTHLDTASGNRITLSNIDERVAHIWEQKFYDINRKVTFGNTPELLVKSEQTNFLSDTITAAEDTLLNSGGTTDAEAPRDLTLNLAANKTKQVFVTLNIPSKTPAGDYQGRLMFKKDGQLAKNIRLKLKVIDEEIADFNDSKYLAGCFNNDKISHPTKSIAEGEKHWFVSEPLFRKRMQVLRRYGCESLTLRADRDTDLKRELEIMTELGFNGPAIINYNNDQVLTSADQKYLSDYIKSEITPDTLIKIPLSWYGVDEPNAKFVTDADELSRYELNKQKIASIQKMLTAAGLTSSSGSFSNQITTSATSDTFKSLKNENVSIYMPIHNFYYNCTRARVAGVTCATDFMARLTDVKDSTDFDMYYFQAYNERPVHSRLMTGFGFLASGFDGFYANPMYGYSDPTISPLYDERSAELTKWHKQMMTFYPARDGYIPTLQSEGLREGITDSRLYLTDLKLRESLVSSSCLPAIKPIDDYIAKFHFTSNEFSLPAGITTNDMDSLRKMIRDDITALSAIRTKGCVSTRH